MKALLFYIFFSLCLIAPDAATDNIFPADSDTPSYKYLVANKVLQNLKKAKGILPHEKPYLKVYRFTGYQKLAVMYPKSGEIHLDELSYDICVQKLGVDSLQGLAFILGHELGHYIRNHGSINHSIQKFESVSTLDGKIQESQEGTTSNSTERTDIKKIIEEYVETKEEAEADLEGGFLGYLAGYQPAEPGKKFLQEAYNHPFTNLNKVTPGYPTLGERIEILDDTGSELDSLKSFFELGNLLMSIGQHEDALLYYEKVSEKFKSSEVYNNMGVVCLKEAIKSFETPEELTLFEFPMGLGQSFANTGNRTKKNENYDFRVVLHLINRGADYFKKASSFNDKYPAAHLNLSIAHTLSAFISQQNGFEATMKTDAAKFYRQSLVNAEAACYTAEGVIDSLVVEIDRNTGISAVEKTELIHNMKAGLSHVSVQLGIIKISQGDPASAMLFFDHGKEMDPNNELASINKIIAQTNKNIKDEKAVVRKCRDREQIRMDNGDLNLDQIYVNMKSSLEMLPEIETKNRDRELHERDLTQQWAFAENEIFELYLNRTFVSKDSVEEALFLVPKPAYSEPTACGINRTHDSTAGMNSEMDILSSYGTPTRIEVNDKHFIVVPSAEGDRPWKNPEKPAGMQEVQGSKALEGIIFQLDHEKHVREWILFSRYRGPLRS